MKKKLTLKELQKTELEMGKQLASLLDKLGIKYFLFFGSLLGCVRHSGFIPWDDDMDFAMPREEYDKLLKHIKETGNKDFENRRFIGYELGNGKVQYLKFQNLEIESDRHIGFDDYLWVDIFPLDGVPSDYEKARKYLRKMYFMHHLYAVKNVKFMKIATDKSETVKNRILKLGYKVCFFFIGRKRLVEKIIKTARSYKFSESENISCAICPAHTKLIFKRKDFEIKKMKFEDTKFNALKGYDGILTANYGDYMKVPPKEKRVTHGVVAYKITNKK